MTLYTGGTFDMFHAGHVNFLRGCKKIADRVVIALNSDEFVQSYKGSFPVFTYKEREAVLRSCRFVNDVVVNRGGADSKPSILEVKPDVIAIGDDWCRKDYYKQMGFTQEWLDENGILLVYMPYTAGISSTEAKKRILSREPAR